MILVQVVRDSGLLIIPTICIIKNIMVGIYKITNPEGKSYIGLSREIEVRWNSYKNMQFQSNTLLKESLKKYDPKNHIFEVIEEIELFEDTYGKNTALLRKRERYWISKFDTFYNGLNQNGGGSGCGSHTIESKQKISKALKGKPKPKDFGEKRSKDFYTDEWKEKISKANKGKSIGKGISKNKGRISPNKGKGKTILQYDKNMNLIQEYPSLKAASIFTNILQPGISSCLTKKYKTAGGYIWKYKS
jgi:group I intron endonuclease